MTTLKSLRRMKDKNLYLRKAQEIFSQEDTSLVLNKASSSLRAQGLIKKAALAVMEALDSGRIRVASWDETQNHWITHAWVKRGILAFFQTSHAYAQSAGVFQFFDKLAPKTRGSLKGVRVVPGAVARYGSFIEEGAILMPSFINVGARVGAGTMVDTWATVGSCAQIGRHVHLSGGVGIGGVLEPPQAAPVILEDHVFVGSRAIVVEGVHVEREAVLGAGVVLTASTKIIDVTSREPKIYRGRVPARSVVIPGTQNKEFPAGTFGVPCALIIGTRKESTDQKTSLNQALRDFAVSV